MSLILRGTLGCLLCGRDAATVSGPHRDQLTATPLDPSTAAAIARGRCPVCLGRLLVSDLDAVFVVDRRPLPEPKVGRPRKRVWANGPPSCRYACAACGMPRVKTTRKRCRDCAATAATLHRLEALLVVLGEADIPLTSRKLGPLLGTSEDIARKLVARARRQGHAIATLGKRGYRLEKSA